MRGDRSGGCNLMKNNWKTSSSWQILNKEIISIMNDSLESSALPTLVLDKTGGVERLQGGQHGLHMGRGSSARTGRRLVGRW